MARAEPLAAETSPTGAVLLERAQSLLPDIRARVSETENGRQVPAETIAAMREAELFKAGRPERFGGYEIGMDELTAIIAEIATACASSAWVYGVLCDHNISLGMFSAKVQDEIWSDDPETLVSSGIAPAGKAERVDGGYKLSGQWSFSSGSAHAQWVFVQSILPPERDGGPPMPTYFVLPRSDYEILDTWYVMGLAGTGSNDIKIEDAFVPEHRTMPVADANEGTGPGTKVNPGLLYRLPRTSTVPYTLVSPAVGIARGLYDTYVAQMRARHSRGVKLAEQATIQMRVAEASAEIDAATLLLQRAGAETMEAMRRDGKLTMEHRARNRRDMGYIVKLCVSAADRLFSATGGAGLYAGNDMQRMFRDVRAVSAHYINSWDIAGTTYGRIALGLDPVHFAI